MCDDSGVSPVLHGLAGHPFLSERGRTIGEGVGAAGLALGIRKVKQHWAI